MQKVYRVHPFDILFLLILLYKLLPPFSILELQILYIHVHTILLLYYWASFFSGWGCASPLLKTFMPSAKHFVSRAKHARFQHKTRSFLVVNAFVSSDKNMLPYATHLLVTVHKTDSQYARWFYLYTSFSPKYVFKAWSNYRIQVMPRLLSMRALQAAMSYM